ncbi:MAG TPA: hypothetical protein VK208_02245 [Pyrinomonadaceae bacterium]|nr:hypothetical protein [Pyrinomonadaceae bacterium]
MIATLIRRRRYPKYSIITNVALRFAVTKLSFSAIWRRTESKRDFLQIEGTKLTNKNNVLEPGDDIVNRLASQ